MAVAFKSLIYYATPFIYVLRLYSTKPKSQKDQSLYIGYTTDLERRIADPNSGKSQATNPFRPYKLIFYEAFLNMKDAKSREEYLKSGWGRRTIGKMLKNYFSE